MNKYFNINFEFDRLKVHEAIAERLKQTGSDYICVSDGVILNTANRFPEYHKVINGGMFSICDSSFVPLYLRRIYGRDFLQYCGSDIMLEIVKARKYRMIFLGSNQPTLDGLKQNLVMLNPDVEGMKFIELPFCKVSQFDYREIAGTIENDGADIIFIALGAPKQEFFMSMLKPFLNHGVMIAVGAAFNFYSNGNKKRAPQWMIRNHLEFVYRLKQEPRKQSKRCFHIIRTLPMLLYKEWRRSKKQD